MTLEDRVIAVASGKVKLLFGSGTSNWNSNGFLNVDIRKLDTVNIACDLSKRLPWEDNKVDEIYAQSIIEHISMGENFSNTIKVLCEWNRVLVTGGILTLKIPDLEALCRIYSEKPDIAISYMYGRQNYPENTHMSGFSIKALYRIFEKSNFKFTGVNKEESYPWEIEIIARKK